MPLDKTTIYAVYEDDGREGPGAQDNSTFPDKMLLIFQNMIDAKKFETTLREGNGRKNPRITGFYSKDEDEILVGCYRVRAIEPTVQQ